MPRRTFSPRAVGLAGAAMFTLLALSFLGFAAGSRQPREPTLTDCLALIQTKQFVDLTHAFEPGSPHWPEIPDEKRGPSWSSRSRSRKAARASPPVKSCIPERSILLPPNAAGPGRTTPVLDTC